MKMKMKKVLVFALILLMSISMFGCKGCKKEEKALSEEPYSEVESVAELDSEETVSEKASEPVSETSEKASEEDSEKASEKTTEKKEKPSEEPSEPPVNPPQEGTPYEIHGAISVSGTCIVDQYGNNFQLCGVSTHGLGWFPEYVNKDSFQSLRDDFGANVVRLALYTAEGAGYCTSGDRNSLKKTVNNGIQYATDLGMYVIVDWHILHDLDPNVYKEDAKVFFQEMSSQYSDRDNIIYEICNEPNGGTSWSSVKSYAEEIIPIIRANDPNAIIVVGTPTWSQDVDIAANDPITGYDNIMYAVHFYADTHKQDLRNKTKKALDKGLPVFITEFSICDASGNGANNITEANNWISFLDQYHLSFAAWSLCNKAESASVISSGCSKTSGWSYDELSESGKWLVGILNTHSDQGSRLASGKPPIAPPGNGGNGGNGGGGNGGDNGNGGGNGGGGNVTPPQEVIGSLGDLSAKVTAANSWETNGEIFTQLNVSVTNNGSGKVSGWKLEIDLGQNVSVDSIWCSTASVSGSKITITPESYNSTLSGNATTSDIGLIVKTSGKIENPSVAIK